MRAFVCGMLALSAAGVGVARGQVTEEVDAASLYMDDPQGGKRGAHSRAVVVASDAQESTADTHRVQTGDTMWSISQRYLGTPYAWPKLWSFNPQVTNPNWIYPDDTMRLRVDAPAVETAVVAEGDGGLAEGAGAVAGQGAKAGGPKVARPRWAQSEVMLRDEAYLDRSAMKSVGEIVGALEEHMILSLYDRVYIQFSDQSEVSPGGFFTVFREVPKGQRNPEEKGTLVRILGDLKIESFDTKTRIAKGVIVEALDPIERGFEVAPLVRRFRMFPPRPNQSSGEGHVVATMRGRQLVGEQDLVFVDFGRKAGLQPGNRLLVTRRGDPWRKSLVRSEKWAGAESSRTRTADVDEPVAELTAVDVKDTTATCVVSGATAPVELGDRVELRNGY